MGQFLALGITTRLVVPRTEAKKADLSLEEVTQEMQKSLHFDEGLYDLTEEDDYWLWQLKKEIWETDLLEFLKNFYPPLYSGSGRTGYRAVLEALDKTAPDAWMALAETRQFEELQFDEYAAPSYLHFDQKPFRPRLRVNFDAVILALEGKIFMETYGTLFGFFAYAIREAFPGHRLAGTIRIYITG